MRGDVRNKMSLINQKNKKNLAADFGGFLLLFCDFQKL